MENTAHLLAVLSSTQHPDQSLIFSTWLDHCFWRFQNRRRVSLTSSRCSSRVRCEIRRQALESINSSRMCARQKKLAH